VVTLRVDVDVQICQQLGGPEQSTDARSPRKQVGRSKEEVGIKSRTIEERVFYYGD
jgi:hypothetical protein